jgi:hypothetical protein
VAVTLPSPSLSIIDSLSSLPPPATATPHRMLAIVTGISFEAKDFMMKPPWNVFPLNVALWGKFQRGYSD